MLRRASCVAFAALCAHAGPLHASPLADSAVYAIIPRPRVLTPKPGHVTLSPRTPIRADPAFADVARRFARDVSPATGYTLPVVASPRAASGAIRLLRVQGRDTMSLGAEGYQLAIATTGVTIRAAHAAGAFYALESFRQLLPPAIYRAAPITGVVWNAPSVHVEDAPRLSWRGSHLDVGRHFMPKEFVLKYIDLVARHKMNRFHWHLTEDQGWRIQIRQYPRLTDVGACRAQTLVGPYVADPAKRVFDRTPHCGCYTQDDIREVVAYAAERFVTVVPEIEMPGHAQAAIAAYPELGVRRDTIVQPMQVWGVSEFILNADDATMTLMQNVLTEVMALFPGQYIHIGGDEAVKNQWISSPQIQSRIRQLGLRDEHELQSWFVRQTNTFLTKHGRRMVGWDEILEGGLAVNATVMSWRGTDGGIAAAKADHDVVMTPGSHTYFDHYQSRDQKAEPLAIGGYLPLDTVYSFEPVSPLAGTRAGAAHRQHAVAVVDGYIRDPKECESMAFPHLSALAEAAWTARDRRDFHDFMQRLAPHLLRLDAMDVKYRKLDEPHAPVP